MRIRCLLALLATASLAATAGAASLKLSDGSTISVSALPVPVASFGRTVGADADQPLVFTMVEPGGRTHGGVVPGSEGGIL